MNIKREKFGLSGDERCAGLGSVRGGRKELLLGVKSKLRSSRTGTRAYNRGVEEYSACYGATRVNGANLAGRIVDFFPPAMKQNFTRQYFARRDALLRVSELS